MYKKREKNRESVRHCLICVIVAVVMLLSVSWAGVVSLTNNNRGLEGSTEKNVSENSDVEKGLIIEEPLVTENRNNNNNNIVVGSKGAKGVSTTSMYLDPAVSTGSTYVNVNISIANVDDLYSWEITLYFDNSILKINSVTEGPFLKSGGATSFISKICSNRIYIVVTLLGAAAGVYGSGVLAIVNFTVLGDAVCSLRLVKPIPIDSFGYRISCAVEDGYFIGTAGAKSKSAALGSRSPKSGGDVFSDNITVSIDPPGNLFANQSSSDIAVNDKVVHVVWQDFRNSNNYDIWYANNTGTGSNPFDNNQKISQDSGTGMQQFPKIAVNGNVVHVVWQDKRGGDWNIYYINSTNGGNSWGSEKVVASGPSGSNQYFPDITVEGNMVFVVWVDDRNGDWDIYMCNSTNGGGVFNPDMRINNDIETNMTQCWPSVATSNGVVHVVWQDKRADDWDIYYASSLDGFSNKRINNDSVGRVQVHPSITAGGGVVNIVWEDYRTISGVTGDLYHVRSTDNGVSFSTNNMVIDDGSTVRDSYPSIDCYGDAVYVAWNTDTSVSCAVSLKGGGAVFGSRGIVASSPSYSSCFDPVVAVNNTKAGHIVWSHPVGYNGAGACNETDIFYRSYEIRSHTYNLLQGWNFIIPLNTSYKRAEDLAQAVGVNCTHVGKWNNTTQLFEAHKKGTNENNFTINNGTGYFIYVEQSTDFIVNTSEILPVSMSLTMGWNSIGWFNSTSTDAKSLANNITNCTAVAYWDNGLGRFVVHVVGTGISNFAVTRGMGCLVYVTSGTEWVNK